MLEEVDKHIKAANARYSIEKSWKIGTFAQGHIAQRWHMHADLFMLIMTMRKLMRWVGSMKMHPLFCILQQLEEEFVIQVCAGEMKWSRQSGIVKPSGKRISSLRIASLGLGSLLQKANVSLLSLSIRRVLQHLRWKRACWWLVGWVIREKERVEKTRMSQTLGIILLY